MLLGLDCVDFGYFGFVCLFLFLIYSPLENGPIVMAEIILAWQIAEQAEREGIAVEDYCKRKGFDEQHRYSGINFNGLLFIVIVVNCC